MNLQSGILAFVALILGVCCILTAVELHNAKTNLLGVPISLSSAEQCTCCSLAGCPCCSLCKTGDSICRMPTKQSGTSFLASSHLAMRGLVSSVDKVYGSERILFFTISKTYLWRMCRMPVLPLRCRRFRSSVTAAHLQAARAAHAYIAGMGLLCTLERMLSPHRQKRSLLWPHLKTRCVG